MVWLHCIAKLPMMARLILYMYLVYNNICYCGMEKGGKERGSRCFYGVLIYIFIVYIYIWKERGSRCFFGVVMYIFIVYIGIYIYIYIFPRRNEQIVSKNMPTQLLFKRLHLLCVRVFFFSNVHVGFTWNQWPVMGLITLIISSLSKKNNFFFVSNFFVSLCFFFLENNCSFFLSFFEKTLSLSVCRGSILPSHHTLPSLCVCSWGG